MEKRIKEESKRGNSHFDSFNNRKIVSSKRSQLTLFIIVAIVIVAVIALIFLSPRIKTIFVPSSPDVELRDCVNKKINEGVGIVSKQGGSVEPVNAIMYEGEKIEYLCYTNQYYKTCVMQVPLLKQHVERELLEYINQEVDKCYEDLKNDLERRGYSVSGKKDVSISIEPNNIKVIVSGVRIEREGAVVYGKIEAGYKSKLYDLIMLTSSILNWEARYGDSDITTYMLYYPNVKVEKYKQQDGSKIYILTERESKEKFVFASRSLSWPAGYGIGQTYNPIIV